MNTAADKTNTRVVYSKESHTLSQPETSFGSWFRQKGRHLTTGKRYKKQDKWWLGIYALSKTALYVFFVLLLAFPVPQPWLYIALGAMGVVIITQMVVTQKTAQSSSMKRNWASHRHYLNYFLYFFSSLGNKKFYEQK
ncbi:MAG: hypothetical protein U5L09_01615 [Bacteroidales bacterium]|nr:hypothetical protein [Bacteroidales bacterium]